MNINTLRNYVELDVDDSFTDLEITRWFNKGIANYNLIEPLTEYPFVVSVLQPNNPAENTFYIDTDYTPLDDNFMLGIMLPFIISAIKGQEFSIQEKQNYINEFTRNARIYKLTHNIEADYLLDKNNPQLDMYKLGDNVYLGDFTKSPMSGTWSNPSVYKEIVILDEED